MKRFKSISLLIVLILIAAFATSCSASGGSNDDKISYSPSVDDSIPYYDGNEYLEIKENPFVKASENPSSMFALSVSTAAYSNLRYYVNNNKSIVPNQINIEQIVNYFRYDYPEPQEGQPLSVTPSLFPCPWNENAYLLTVGLKAKTVETDNVKNNLVFLLDVSGSMSGANKLGLLKQAFLLLLDNLGENDTVSIVTYSGSHNILLDGGNGEEKTRISGIIESLSAGGSTAGARAIQTAYELARKHFIEDGNNRVILATDGDFNVGISSPQELKNFISEKRDAGIYLTALGFGYGNLQSDTLETLANNGDGSYAYIDTVNEARKVMVEEICGMLNIVAKDAKARVDFNADYIDSYRLLGYENLLLNEDEWEDPQTDAGEIGMGFTVTAVYEVLFKEEADLAAEGANFLMAAVRYKSIDISDTEQYEITASCGIDNIFETPTRDMAFISALVETALLLRNSQYKGTANMLNVVTRLRALNLNDNEYMVEFLSLAEKIASYYFHINLEPTL